MANDFSGKQALLQELFAELDPAVMGENYRKALREGNEKELIRATAEFFRSRKESAYCQLIDCSGCSLQEADRAAAADVTVINIPWHFPDGRIDWFFNPTKAAPPVNHEWLWQLNRMTFWKDLAFAYTRTGDEKYAKAFNDQLFSWVSTAGVVGAEWNIADCVWRTIEAGLRMMYSWPLGFEVFRKSSSFTDENLCLMLGSMFRHALHLRDHHKTRTNWLLMEMTGLYTFAVLFQEFKESCAFRQYAAQKFSGTITGQILPDGMYDELSPDYHSVMFSCAFAFYNIAKAEKINAELPAGFLETLELSYQSVLEMATPGLTSPRTNDCFTCSAAKKMEQAFAMFPHRQDFRWGATHRKEGTAPASHPSSSRFLPWAGFAVMRSSWEADAAYCCFDAGPLGMAHIHQDKLNINIYKGSEELICDDGGGQYEHSIYRAYGLSGADHNTILADGLMQRRQEPRKVSEPVDVHWESNERFDYACGVYDDEFGVMLYDEASAAVPLQKIARHTRELLFAKPDIFCVADTVESLDGKAHSYEMRLHLDTEKMERFEAIPGAWISDFGLTWDILIVPLFRDKMVSKVLSGEDTMPMGGWFIGRNDMARHKSSTLTMTVAGEKNCRFATLLIPVKRNEAMPLVTREGKELFAVEFKGNKFLFDVSAEKLLLK